LEAQPCLDDTGVIEYQQGAGREVASYVPVYILRKGIVLSDQQPGGVPFLQGVQGDLILGQFVVEIGDGYFSRIHMNRRPTAAGAKVGKGFFQSMRSEEKDGFLRYPQAIHSNSQFNHSLSGREWLKCSKDMVFPCGKIKIPFFQIESGKMCYFV
jgi:hypothetical protein